LSSSKHFCPKLRIRCARKHWTDRARAPSLQAHQAYNRHLSKLIQTGKAKSSFLVSHELSLDEAPDAYKHFDARETGWTKVILKPGMAEAKKGQAASAGHQK
jgi:glutathione-independent formaldehyde dehydrogenase